MIFKDYYAILELPFDCAGNEIKKSYRRLAKQWHPDKNPGIDTADKMRDVIEANLILSDPEARSKYDLEFKKYENYISEVGNSQETKNVYEYDDEVLKKWVRNAREQSVIILKELIKEIRESFNDGISGALNGMANFILGKKWI